MPSNSTCPLSGTSSPAMTRSIVVLPQPLGPSTTAAAERHFERDTVQRHVGFESLRDVDQRDAAAFTGPHAWSEHPNAATGTKMTADCNSASTATWEDGVLAMIV